MRRSQLGGRTGTPNALVKLAPVSTLYKETCAGRRNRRVRTTNMSVLQMYFDPCLLVSIRGLLHGLDWHSVAYCCVSLKRSVRMPCGAGLSVYLVYLSKVVKHMRLR